MRVGGIHGTSTTKWTIAVDSLINRLETENGGLDMDDELPMFGFGGALYNMKETVCGAKYCRKQPFGGTYYLNTNNKLIYG